MLPTSRGTRVALRLLSVATFAVVCAFWHHGHIAIFLSLVREHVAGRLPKRRRLRMEPSALHVELSDGIAWHVAVQRKTRGIDVGLAIERTREENQRWALALARRADEIRAQLGPDAELDEWTRRATRLHELRPVGGEAWRPKESLTAELAREIAERLLRYVEVLEPIVREERAAVRR